MLEAAESGGCCYRTLEAGERQSATQYSAPPRPGLPDLRAGVALSLPERPPPFGPLGSTVELSHRVDPPPETFVWSVRPLFRGRTRTHCRPRSRLRRHCGREYPDCPPAEFSFRSQRLLVPKKTLSRRDPLAVQRA